MVIRWKRKEEESLVRVESKLFTSQNTQTLICRDDGSSLADISGEVPMQGSDAPTHLRSADFFIRVRAKQSFCHSPGLKAQSFPFN